MGNKETEQAAITHVLALEHRQVAAAQANPERSRPQVTHWPTFRAAEYDQAERLR